MLGRGKKDLIIGKPRIRRAVGALLLGSLLVWAMGHDARESRRRIVQLDMEQIRRAARYFRQDFGRCPHDALELAHPPAGREPYLAHEPIDPWGRPYTLQCPSRWDEEDVDVATPGPDGHWLGGDDMSTDL